MKIFKKNKIILYTMALMLVVAGYLSYTSNNDMKSIIQTSSTEEELAKTNIGDAQLVSSNDIVSENETIEEDKENVKEKNEETKETTSTEIKNNDSYFSTSKLERNTMYSQMIETYEKILNSTSSLETQKQSATEEITKINNTKNSIMICENLIQTKGFSNCVIFVNGDSISVIVEDDQLSPEKVAQIQNIVTRELKAKAENIHISNK